MPFSDDEVRQILEAAARSDWDELRLVSGDLTLVMSRTGAPTLTAAPASAPAVEHRPPAAGPSARRVRGAIEEMDSSHAETGAPPVTTGGDHAVTVLAPSLGLFWRSPKPGAPPFVEAGDRVGPDSTVCIVEVMKLMNHVKAGCTGVVSAIHPANGDMVEYGDALVSIVPDG